MNCEVYGEGTLTNQIYQKWFVNFLAGDLSLNNLCHWGNQLRLIYNHDVI